MAGGRGTRLQPLTFALPKPLLPVGERPIVEILLCQLARQGFERVWVSLGHKGQLIRAYLEQSPVRGIAVSWMTEDTPLGTAGSLRLLPKQVEHCFVVNGDILTEVDFSAVLQQHVASGYDATAVVHRHDVTLPYGVIELDQQDSELVRGIEEKPTLHLPVATGMYALSRPAIDSIPEGRCDMPELLNLLAAGGRLRAHQIDAFWTDVADLASYEAVNLDSDRWDNV